MSPVAMIKVNVTLSAVVAVLIGVASITQAQVLSPALPKSAPKEAPPAKPAVPPRVPTTTPAPVVPSTARPGIAAATDEPIASQIGAVQLSNSPAYVAVAGHYAFVGSTFGSLPFFAIDISNRAHPAVIGRVDLEPAGSNGVGVTGVTVSKDLAYVLVLGTGGRASHLKIVDVSNPAHPVIESTLDLGPQGDVSKGPVALAGGFAIIASGQNLLVIDVRSPHNPRIAQRIPVPEAGHPDRLEHDVTAVAAAGRYIYALGSAGVHVFRADMLDAGVDAKAAPITQVATVMIGANEPQAAGLNIDMAYSNGFLYVTTELAELYVLDVREPEKAAIIARLRHGLASFSTFILSAAGGFLTLNELDADRYRTFDLRSPGAPKPEPIVEFDDPNLQHGKFGTEAGGYAYLAYPAPQTFRIVRLH